MSTASTNPSRYYEQTNHAIRTMMACSAPGSPERHEGTKNWRRVVKLLAFTTEQKTTLTDILG